MAPNGVTRIFVDVCAAFEPECQLLPAKIGLPLAALGILIARDSMRQPTECPRGLGGFSAWPAQARAFSLLLWLLGTLRLHPAPAAPSSSQKDAPRGLGGFSA